MGSVDRERLQKFLEENAKDLAMVPEVMGFMEEFFRIAEMGLYLLQSKSKLDKSDVRSWVANAIHSATGQEVRKVTLISKTDPLPKPAWMSREVFEEHLLKNIRRHVVATIGQRALTCMLKRSFFGDDARAGAVELLHGMLEEGVLQELYRVLCGSDHSLETLLRQACYRSWNKDCEHLERGFGDNWGEYLFGKIYESLLYLLVFTVLGEWERVERLKPLIAVLPLAIPLGEKKDEPGTWLVLCA
ncbi:hypothetical protein AMJ57_05025 [Parcubacteria bacterium SG8_24]|nr:MAG: hypothetical protein AMJ57_05025 [Parcubacteria bacterium SG8_24]